MTEATHDAKVPMKDEWENPVDQAKDFVNNPENIVVADNTDDAECGDERYTPKQSAGKMRAFGGGVGIIASFLAAAEEKGIKLEPERLVDGYLFALRAVRGPHAKIHYHTDEHGQKEGKPGCGDIAQSTNPANKNVYAGSAEGVKALFAAVKNLPATDVEETILSGEHDGAWALWIEGKGGNVPEYSINSRDSKTGKSGFVVDAGRVKDFIRRASPHVINPYQISPEDVIKSWTKRTQATASILAPGKPLITVEMDGPNATIINTETIRPA